jgi:hypothetical protein
MTGNGNIMMAIHTNHDEETGYAHQGSDDHCQTDQYERKEDKDDHAMPHAQY